MKTFLDNLTLSEISLLGEEFRKSVPFNHLVIDNFLSYNDAVKIADEFPDFDNEFWYSYDNPLEIKKASNDWNKFGPYTYKYFTHILSKEYSQKLSLLLSESNINLIPDIGLHGGGFHTHKNGGRLNPHLDYSIHPKLFIQRKINLILYINPYWKKEYGGDLGFWSDLDGQPNKLVKEIDCRFNRAIIFDTSQNSWHGISKEINSENKLTRNSLASYYLVEPSKNTDKRMKVKYAPRDDQKGNMDIQELIEKRQSIHEFNLVYKINKEL